MQKKPVYRAVRLGEAANDLIEAEYLMSQLESNDVFEACHNWRATMYLRHSVQARNDSITSCSISLLVS